MRKRRRTARRYKRRLHKPLIDIGSMKTTSREGYNAYMKEYMRRSRQAQKRLKKIKKVLG